MKTCAALFLLLIISMPAAAQMAPYWVPDAGVELTFENDAFGGRMVIVLPGMIFSGTDYYATFTENYTSGEDGNLYRTGGGYCSPDIMGCVNHTYTPPIKVLDYPLTTGKVWSSESRRTSDGGTLPRDVTWVGTVIGPTTVETAIGSFNVIEIEIARTVVSTTTTTYYLHQQLGDVKDLVAYTGVTVANEDFSFGGVKALYRQ